MAKAELIDFTGAGRSDERWHAADMLIFTKSTRLNMDSGLMDAVKRMSDEEKLTELAYMANTIPSSWEFADVTFLLTGVSRAGAQQITRTRNASYAMQSLRVVDASDIGVVNPFEEASILHGIFGCGIEDALDRYSQLIADGAAAQDARGILPLNTECNLVAKYNLRNFVDLIKARSSLRVQGEYAELADQMKAAVLAVWPWAEPFFEHPQSKAISILESVAKDLGITPGKGAGWDIAKAIDLIKKG